MSNEERIYKLGATAPTLETIRDFLRNDRDLIRREIAKLSSDIERMGTTLERLQGRINEMDEVALDLLDKIIEGNAETTIQVIEG